MKTNIDTIREAYQFPEESIDYLWNRANIVGEVNTLNMLEYVSRLEAAISTIDPDAETGWMIEKTSGIPMWWRGLPKREGSDSWSTDPLQGIRFVRKVDAEVCALAQGYKLSAVRATDHRWG